MCRLKDSNPGFRIILSATGEAQATNQAGKTIRNNIAEHVSGYNHTVVFRILGQPHHLSIDIGIPQFNLSEIRFLHLLGHFIHHAGGLTNHIRFFTNRDRFIAVFPGVFKSCSQDSLCGLFGKNTGRNRYFLNRGRSKIGYKFWMCH